MGEQGHQIANSEKKPSSSFNNYKKMKYKQPPILRNLLYTFYLQLGTKEYLTCWKTLNQIGHFNIKPN